MALRTGSQVKLADGRSGKILAMHRFIDAPEAMVEIDDQWLVDGTVIVPLDSLEGI